MLPGKQYKPEDVLEILRRRIWVVLLPFAVVAAGTAAGAKLLPDLYRADTLILVVPQRVPESYVRSTVTTRIEDRLQSISQQILSRTRLERIIEEFNLYAQQRRVGIMEDVVQKMRTDITTSAAGKDVNSFRVSYVSDEPEKARKVTERLASLYIEQNLKDRENQADSTSQFLNTQLEEAKRRLIEQEKKLESYRKSHAGQLPSQLQGNLQASQTASLQLQSLNESTNRAQERRLLIERQIADSKVVPVGGGTNPEAAAAPVGTAQQLDVARARLSLALQRYTPSHPEVVSLEHTIADLVAKLESETPVGSIPAEQKKPATPAEAEQQKRILDLQAELAVIDYQLAANRAEATRLNALIGQYQAKIDVVPTRESELVELTRDYGTMQAAYTNLLVKREDAMLAANLERRQIGEQFKLLDTASLPGKPSNQMQRVGIIASGAAVGLAMGLLSIGLLEYRDSSFRTEAEAVRTLSIPVFAQIPMMISDRERHAARRRAWFMDAGGAVILLLAAFVLVLWRLRS